MRFVIFFAAWGILFPALATEQVFTFTDFTASSTPTNFTSLVAGPGRLGEWRVVLEQTAPALAPLTGKATSVASRAVLAQRAREPVNGHLPMLIYDRESYRDFKFTTRFKLVGGALDQSAGMIFHFQNISNFYVVQASAIGGNFRCSKVVDGEIKPPIGPEITVTRGEWHEMSVQCEGPRITCSLDGNAAIKLVDNASSKVAGKIGFCTQADAVSYFVDARVTFTPQEVFAEKMVRQVVQEFSKLVSLKIYASRLPEKGPEIIASSQAREVGNLGGATEREVIATGHSFFGRGQETVTVMLPLRDNNGDVMAAVSIEMKKFIGQTEGNALVRAQPILRRMQAQVQKLEDLLQ